MTTTRHIFLLIAWCLAGLAAAEPPLAPGSRMREWQGTDGTPMKARMLGSTEQAVSLKLDGSGKITQVPFTELSEADRRFATETGWKLPQPWSKWPADIKLGPGEIQVDLVSSAPRKYVYHTRHFEFISGGELGQEPARDIARIFEATYQLLQASPWGVLAKPTDGRFRAEFYRSREEYIAAGGPKESAGVYISQRKVFMVPFETLGLEATANGWQRSKEYSTRTLVHELTHMMMDEALPAMPMWLAEGTAEYMERMPMKTGTFAPGSHLAAIQERHKTRPAFDLGRTFVMDQETWQRAGIKARAAVPPSPLDPHTIRPPMGGASFAHKRMHQLYEAGLLLTYYFIHLDGDGDAARLQRFIAACVKNSARLNDYNIRAKEYNQAFEEFTKRPDVKQVGDNRYEYPAELKPPVPPQWPFEGKPEDLAIHDLELLLEGRSVAAVMAEAQQALGKIGLPPIPKPIKDPPDRQ